MNRGLIWCVILILAFVLTFGSLVQPVFAVSWYNASWQYRISITVAHGKVGAALTNYPVYVDLSLLPASFFSNVRSDGGDIRVTQSDGVTEVAREVVTISTAGKTGELFFNAPTLSNSVDTVFYIYYGNPAATDYATNATYGAQKVWDSNYAAVYHFPNGTTLSANDSTSHAYNGTISGATATTGKLDGGVNLNGSSADITTSYTQTSATAYTIEAWLNTTTTNTAVIVSDRGSGAGQSLTLGLDGAGACGGTSCGSIGSLPSPTGKPMWGDDSNAIFLGIEGTSALNNGSWHFLAGTWSASSGTGIAPAQFALYVDGSVVSSPGSMSAGSDASPLTGLSGTVIGYHQSWKSYASGTFDEVRISTSSRASTWISTEYNNESSDSTFLTFGSQVSNATAPARIVRLFEGFKMKFVSGKLKLNQQ